jgi:hypothetical protein
MKIMGATQFSDPVKWQEMSKLLDEGHEVHVPMQPAHIAALKSAMVQITPSDSDISRAQGITIRSLDIHKDVLNDMQSKQITYPFNWNDATKGGAVGLACGGVLGSLANTAKNINQPVLFALSFMTLGAVLYPEIVKKFHESDVTLKADGITFKRDQS